MGSCVILFLLHKTRWISPPAGQPLASRGLRSMGLVRCNCLTPTYPVCVIGGFRRGWKDVSWTAWPLKMEPTGSHETSFSTHLTPRNNPEDGRIQVIQILEAWHIQHTNREYGVKCRQSRSLASSALNNIFISRNDKVHPFTSLE